jgi:hypothetical protein
VPSQTSRAGKLETNSAIERIYLPSIKELRVVGKRILQKSEWIGYTCSRRAMLEYLQKKKEVLWKKRNKPYGERQAKMNPTSGTNHPDFASVLYPKGFWII